MQKCPRRYQNGKRQSKLEPDAYPERTSPITSLTSWSEEGRSSRCAKTTRLVWLPSRHADAPGTGERL